MIFSQPSIPDDSPVTINSSDLVDRPKWRADAEYAERSGAQYHVPPPRSGKGLDLQRQQTVLQSAPECEQPKQTPYFSTSHERWLPTAASTVLGVTRAAFATSPLPPVQTTELELATQRLKWRAQDLDRVLESGCEKLKASADLFKMSTPEGKSGWDSCRDALLGSIRKELSSHIDPLKADLSGNLIECTSLRSDLQALKTDVTQALKDLAGAVNDIKNELNVLPSIQQRLDQVCSQFKCHTHTMALLKEEIESFRKIEAARTSAEAYGSGGPIANVWAEESRENDRVNSLAKAVRNQKDESSGTHGPTQSLPGVPKSSETGNFAMKCQPESFSEQPECHQLTGRPANPSKDHLKEDLIVVKEESDGGSTPNAAPGCPTQGTHPFSAAGKVIDLVNCDYSSSPNFRRTPVSQQGIRGRATIARMNSYWPVGPEETQKASPPYSYPVHYYPGDFSRLPLADVSMYHASSAAGIVGRSSHGYYRPTFHPQDMYIPHERSDARSGKILSHRWNEQALSDAGYYRHLGYNTHPVNHLPNVQHCPISQERQLQVVPAGPPTITNAAFQDSREASLGRMPPLAPGAVNELSAMGQTPKPSTTCSQPPGGFHKPTQATKANATLRGQNSQSGALTVKRTSLDDLASIFELPTSTAVSRNPDDKGQPEAPADQPRKRQKAQRTVVGHARGRANPAKPKGRPRKQQTQAATSSQQHPPLGP